MDPIIKIGQPAPLFELPDMNGFTHSLRAYTGQIVIINFWSAECPWSERVDEALRPLVTMWGKKAVYLPIAANQNEPIELVREIANQRGLLAVLMDINNRVADAYGAKTTPHIFLLDGIGMLRYQGAFDDVTFQRGAPTTGYLENAVEALLRGEQPETTLTDPYGCTILRGSES